MGGKWAGGKRGEGRAKKYIKAFTAGGGIRLWKGETTGSWETWKGPKGSNSIACCFGLGETKPQLRTLYEWIGVGRHWRMERS